MKPVFLCGFMGCGKSTVGHELSKLLGCDFVDIDSYIEENEGMTIPEIFKRFGEKHFRKLETEAILKLCNKPAVIAAGGGALISDENAAAAASYGKIVCIKLDFEKCYQRIKNNPYRPIVVRSTKKQLKELYNNRSKVYLQRSSIVVNGDSTPREIAKEIISYL
ncbi:MAG: shikimate kinase [Oscillospiraceae bacterium]|jgi:shikimate kinase